MVSFEQLTPADAPLLSTIGAITVLQSHGHSAPDGIMQAYTNKNFGEDACRAELADPQNIFTAVYYNNQPAGYFKIICNTPHPKVPLQPVTKLERLYLLEDYHGLKLGHGLLQHAVAISKKAGDQGMWLDVWKKNDRALRFYEKQGFETVGESQFVVTATHANPIWVMLLRY